MESVIIGTDIVVRWKILYSDGSPFPLGRYNLSLVRYNAIGKTEITPSHWESTPGEITISFSGNELPTSGRHDLLLRIMDGDRLMTVVRYTGAFSLRRASAPGETKEIAITSYCDAIGIRESIMQGMKAVDASTTATERSETALANSEKAVNDSTQALERATSAEKSAEQSRLAAERAEQLTHNNADEISAKATEIIEGLALLNKDQSEALALAIKVNALPVIVSLSQAEYDALSEEEKNNGKFYFIEEE